MKPLRGQAINRAVRDYVKDYIIRNKLQAGDALPSEAELSQRLGVGRSSIREAVKSLESLGIVEIQRGNGTFVREYNLDPVLETFLYGVKLDFKSVFDLMKIRLWLETAAMDDVIDKMTDQTLHDLERILELWQARIEQGEDRYAVLDARFHDTLYSVLGNQMLQQLSRVFWVLAQELREEHDIQAQSRGMEVVHEHRDILDAVRQRDVEAARQTLTLSYQFGIQEFRRALDEQTS